MVESTRDQWSGDNRAGGWLRCYFSHGLLLDLLQLPKIEPSRIRRTAVAKEIESLETALGLFFTLINDSLPPLRKSPWRLFYSRVRILLINLLAHAAGDLQETSPT